jgi:hypothetical protein
MRAGPLSNPKIVELLNQYFVPVHADGVFYSSNQSVPADERAAYRRLFQELHELNQKNKADGKPLLSVGSVHAYVLAPDGKPLESLHVAEAKPEAVTAMLEKAIQALKVPQGKPLVKPIPQALPPPAKPGFLVLHVTTRYLVSKNDPRARKDIDDDLVPIQPSLGLANSGQWNALPSEDWPELKKADWLKLLPAGAVKVGDSWEPDRDVAKQILVRLYPTTENNDLATNRIDKQELKATVVSSENGVVRAELQGSLKMKHTFYPRRDDDRMVDASLIGYIEFQQDRSRIRSLRLVTDRATYGGSGQHFGAAVKSIPSVAE